MRRAIIPIFFISGGVIIAASQFTSDEVVDPSPKTEKNDTTRVDEFTRSVFEDKDYVDFNYHSHTYQYDCELNALWTSYLESNPEKLWTGPINHFVLHRSADGHYDSGHVTEGSRILLELHLFKNKPLKVLFEVTKICSEEMKIEFCYDKSNITQGIQIISFYEEGSITHIKHETYFKSHSKLRDKIYPIYHQRCIDEFHAAIHNNFLMSNPELDM